VTGDAYEVSHRLPCTFIGESIATILRAVSWPRRLSTLLAIPRVC